MNTITNSGWTCVHGDKEINEMNKNKQATKEFNKEGVEGQSRICCCKQKAGRHCSRQADDGPHVPL